MGAKEYDVLKNLAFYPTVKKVPLVFGMYNGQVVGDEASKSRAEGQSNYFNPTTGAYLPDVMMLS